MYRDLRQQSTLIEYQFLTLSIDPSVGIPVCSNQVFVKILSVPHNLITLHRII